MYGLGESETKTTEKIDIKRRVRICDYLAVAQLFLQDNFFLDRPLTPDDVKPRLLGHWGTCHGINVVYANLKADLPDAEFVLGPGHGFPALQANLFIDGELEKVDKKATINRAGVAYICRNFSWPGGFPSHASPITPGVICEGGELGYSLGVAYGSALGHPEKTVAVLIGDGEFETASMLSSLNLVKLLGDHTANGRVLPILHLNGYKISGPTISARKSERELAEQIRGFGYTPLFADEEDLGEKIRESKEIKYPFIIFKSEKGATGPAIVHGKKVSGNFLSHQIPLKNAKTDPKELKILESWLKSYHFGEEFLV